MEFETWEQWEEKVIMGMVIVTIISFFATVICLVSEGNFRNNCDNCDKAIGNK